MKSRHQSSAGEADEESVHSRNNLIDNESHIHRHIGTDQKPQEDGKMCVFCEDSSYEKRSKSSKTCRKCISLSTPSLSPYQLPSTRSYHRHTSSLNAFFCNCARVYADLKKPARSFPHEINAMAIRLTSLVDLLVSTSLPDLDQILPVNASATCSCCLHEIAGLRETWYCCTFLKLMSSFLPTLREYGYWIKKKQEYLNQPILHKASHGNKAGSLRSEASQREGVLHGNSDAEGKDSTERYDKLVTNMEDMLALHRLTDQIVSACDHVLALVEFQEKIDQQIMPSRDCVPSTLIKLKVSFLYRIPQLKSISNDYKEIIYEVKTRLSDLTETILEHVDNVALEVYRAVAPSAKQAKQSKSNDLMRYLERLHVVFLKNLGTQALQNPSSSTTYLLPKIVNQCLQPTFIDLSILSMQLNDVMAFQIDQALKAIKLWYREIETSYNAVNSATPNPCAKWEACIRPYIGGYQNESLIMTSGILYPKLALQDIYTFTLFDSILGIWLEASADMQRPLDKLIRRQLNIQKIRQAFKKNLTKHPDQKVGSESLSDNLQLQAACSAREGEDQDVSQHSNR